MKIILSPAEDLSPEDYLSEITFRAGTVGEAEILSEISKTVIGFGGTITFNSNGQSLSLTVINPENN